MVTEADYKLEFARQTIVQKADPFQVCLQLFPREQDVAYALWAGMNWPKDPEVKHYQQQIVDKPFEAGMLADRYQTARELLERARKCRSYEHEEYVKIMTLYAKVMQLIDMPASTQTNVQVNNHMKVIQVPAMMDMRQWENIAVVHQERLTNGSSGTILPGN